MGSMLLAYASVPPLLFFIVTLGTLWALALLAFPLALAWWQPRPAIMLGIIINIALIAAVIPGVTGNASGSLLSLYLPAALCIAGMLRLAVNASRRGV